MISTFSIRLLMKWLLPLRLSERAQEVRKNKMRKRRKKRDYSFLLELIPYGKQNAISGERLAKKLNMNVRGLCALIHSARVSGLLILSGDVGYWRSDNLDEMKEFYKRMRSQGIGTLAAAKSARLKIKEIEETKGE